MPAPVHGATAPLNIVAGSRMDGTGIVFVTKLPTNAYEYLPLFTGSVAQAEFIAATNTAALARAAEATARAAGDATLSNVVDAATNAAIVDAQGRITAATNALASHTELHGATNTVLARAKWAADAAVATSALAAAWAPQAAYATNAGWSSRAQLSTGALWAATAAQATNATAANWTPQAAYATNAASAAAAMWAADAAVATAAVRAAWTPQAALATGSLWSATGAHATNANAAAWAPQAALATNALAANWTPQAALATGSLWSATGAHATNANAAAWTPQAAYATNAGTLDGWTAEGITNSAVTDAQLRAHAATNASATSAQLAGATNAALMKSGGSMSGNLDMNKKVIIMGDGDETHIKMITEYYVIPMSSDVITNSIMQLGGWYVCVASNGVALANPPVSVYSEFKIPVSRSINLGSNPELYVGYGSFVAGDGIAQGRYSFGISDGHVLTGCLVNAQGNVVYCNDRITNTASYAGSGSGAIGYGMVYGGIHGFSFSGTGPEERPYYIETCASNHNAVAGGRGAQSYGEGSMQWGPGIIPQSMKDTFGCSKLLVHSNATMYGNLDMGGNAITNLATPTGPTMAATKGYVDGIAGQIPRTYVLNIVPYRAYGGSVSMLSPLDIAPGGLRALAWTAYFYDVPAVTGLVTVIVRTALNGASGAIFKFTNLSAHYTIGSTPGSTSFVAASWSWTNSTAGSEHWAMTNTVTIPAGACATSFRVDAETVTPASQTGMIERVIITY